MKRVIFPCVVLIWSAVVFAQSDRATIRGTVIDPTGAVVPKAEIVASDIATNTIARTVRSDENGNYEIADLKRGTYRLKADASGFKTFVEDNLLMEGGQVRRVDIAFQVGSTTETISVEGGAAVITTETGTLSGTITAQNFKDSPHVNPYPSVYAMLTTVPGIQGSGWQARVSGQSPTQLSMGFDGIENDRYGDNTNNISFYEEVQVSTANNTADNARVASFNMTSKSGTNQFHGMVYYKHFNSALNARNFFDPKKRPSSSTSGRQKRAAVSGKTGPSFTAPGLRTACHWARFRMLPSHRCRCAGATSGSSIFPAR